MKKKEDIIKLPDSRLRQKSKRVGFIDQEILSLVEDMKSATLDWEASRAHETGAALAAVQLGQLWRVIIVRNNIDDRGNPDFTAFINPEITKREGEPSEELEGCLSVESLYGSVMRYPKVKVKALDVDGKEVRVTAHDFLARVFQHEIDHCNGLVFLDHVTDGNKIFEIQPDGSFVKANPNEK
jgi:peptide deformylase